MFEAGRGKGSDRRDSRNNPIDVVRALKHIHTARQTRALHKIPSIKAGINSNEALVFAVFNATSPTAPSPNVYCVE